MEGKKGGRRGKGEDKERGVLNIVGRIVHLRCGSRGLSPLARGGQG